MPSTVYDAKGLLKSAIRDDNPVLYLENRMMYMSKEEVPDGEWLVPIGVAEVRRTGSDVTVVATGGAVTKALAAASSLAGKVDAEVIDPRTLSPLDMGTILTSVRKTGRLLVVQEGPPMASFGAEVVRRCAEEGFADLKQAPRLLGARAVPVPFSPALEDAYIPQEKDIVAAIEQMR
jgi:pyruvate/2-oxoglutarate/acetoin dehydrogenase E1 component